jgi:leader peptidase (prepilin peptidase) / N-methyltransferase
MMERALLLSFGALVGLCVGSFAATAALRLARGEQAVLGRSHCDGCGAELSFAQTLPVAAFVRFRGACPICGGRIDPLHLVAELTGAAVVLAALAVAAPLRASLLAAIGLALLATSIADLRTRRLPDVLTAAIAVLGVGASVQRSQAAAVEGLVAAVVSFVLLEGLRRGFAALRGKPGLGFGDVKLIAALALWIGLATPWAVALAAALGLLASRFMRVADGRLPFGPFIGVAAFAVGIAGEVHPWPM